VVVVSLDSSEELRNFMAFEINVVEGASEVLLRSDIAVDEVSADEEELLGFWGSFAAFMEKMWKESRELVNLDTTTLVAIVSGISNGGVRKLMAAPEAETRARFKCNYKFVIDQVA
jgi:helix-turn-helix protein